MWQRLPQLRQSEDAPLNYRLEVNSFAIGQDGMESNQLFFRWVAGSDSKFHL
jgi:hypothetical protein